MCGIEVGQVCVELVQVVVRSKASVVSRVIRVGEFLWVGGVEIILFVCLCADQERTRGGIGVQRTRRGGVLEHQRDRFTHPLVFSRLACGDARLVCAGDVGGASVQRACWIFAVVQPDLSRPDHGL